MLMGQAMKHYALIVTTVIEQTIYVTAADPGLAMFEAGRRMDQEAGREKDRYIKLREVPDAEWEANS